MDESSNESSGERESQQPDSAKTPASKMPAGEAAESAKHDGNLPVVWSPKLDAGEAITEESRATDADEAAAPADEALKADVHTGAGAPDRSSRFALLAAAVAIAAALGSFAGSLSATGVAHLWPAPAAGLALVDTHPSQANKAELAELATLKANLDNATRGTTGQFAKLTDRLDRVEHAQLEPATKITHIADAVDRLEKRTAALPAAPETTGSIAASQPPAPSEPKQPERVLPDWVVQSVQGDRALVENRFGGIFYVSTGSVLPGLGRVETIKRQDGEWMVVTARGLITSTGR
jgi:hypothetical protein